ncbi:MAG: DNA alkylation repair protein [Anaerolineae bacterium]|nr:DNA alkylation repair protein [Anaerolineae bacterium]
MNATEMLETLKALGTEQTRKTYRRHAPGANVYGVLHSEIQKLYKKVKKEHEAAPALWESGVYEGRLLATMIADPASLDKKTLETWGNQVSDQGIADALAGLIFKTPYATAIRDQWLDAKEEYTARIAWTLLSLSASEDQLLPDSFFLPYLEIIERDIHTAPNRVREMMNYVVINIGVRNPELEARAVAAAQKIGKVEIDHGDTYCKTPDAIVYINRVKSYRKAQAEKKAQKQVKAQK